MYDPKGLNIAQSKMQLHSSHNALYFLITGHAGSSTSFFTRFDRLIKVLPGAILFSATSKHDEGEQIKVYNLISRDN